MTKICMHFIVSGRVQGVWYRAKTKDKATSLDVTGWVQNLSDGRVELIACGEEEQIHQLEQWLWQGPPLAKVTHIEKSKMELQEFSDFGVR